MPHDLTEARPHEPQLCRRCDVVPAPRRDVLHEASVERKVGDPVADVLDGTSTTPVPRLVEVEGVLAVGVSNREDAVGQLHDLVNSEARVQITSTLILVISDALDKLPPRHVAPPKGIGDTNIKACTHRSVKSVRYQKGHPIF